MYAFPLSKALSFSAHARMNDNASVVNPETATSNPLAFTYPCYKDMSDNNIIFMYKGMVSSDLVTHVLDIMEDRLEEDRQSKRLSKKVFNVMVECLTNIYSTEEANARAKFDPTAVLLVKREEDSYVVTTGHYIYNEKVQELKRILDRINNMKYDELKDLHMQVLVKEDPAQNGLTDLAIVDLARKSRHKLIYQFKYVTPEYTFFSLEARISKNSI